MNIVEKLTIQNFHQHRIQHFGEETVEALGWKNKYSQQKRFEILCQIADLEGQNILDVGCGHGDLKIFLDERLRDFNYIGVDQMKEFIEVANDFFKDDPTTHFIEGDFSKVFFSEVDYILGSGAFGYKCQREEYYWETIMHLYNNCKKGVAFNMLDDRYFKDHPLLKSHNKEEVVKFCDRLASRIEVVDGYLEDDFTVFMYK